MYKYSDGFSNYHIQGLDDLPITLGFSVEECAEGFRKLGKALSGAREICSFCDNDITNSEDTSCPKCGAPRE